MTSETEQSKNQDFHKVDLESRILLRNKTQCEEREKTNFGWQGFPN